VARAEEPGTDKSRRKLISKGYLGRKDRREGTTRDPITMKRLWQVDVEVECRYGSKSDLSKDARK
jgi:hypothetical protein